jgi:hypothetical protein
MASALEVITRNEPQPESDLVQTEARNQMLKATETFVRRPSTHNIPTNANRAQLPPTTHAPATRLRTLPPVAASARPDPVATVGGG